MASPTPTPSRGRSGSMVGTPSFVWVTDPRNKTSHQAELLEIQESGYLVRWTVSRTEELISLNSVLEQTLPRRRRRSTAFPDHTESTTTPTKGDKKAKDESTDDPPDKKKEKHHDNKSSSSPKKQQSPPPQKVRSDEPTPKKSNKGPKKAGKQPPINKEPPKIEPQLLQEFIPMSAAERAKTFKRKAAQQSQINSNNNSRSSSPIPKARSGSPLPKTARSSSPAPKARSSSPTGKPPRKAAEQPTKKKIRNNMPKPSPSDGPLFQIHQISQSTAEARVAQLLRDHDLAPTASFVTGFLLFCHERQSCWYRRNNEENPVWTQSNILQKYNFCNVYRELDRGTCYLRYYFVENYLQMNERLKEDAAKRKKAKKPPRRRDFLQYLLWTSYCYRQVNRMEPFLNFGSIPSQQNLSKWLEFVAQLEEKQGDFFTTCYDTPDFDDYHFHLQRLLEANGWLLKSIAGRLAQCRTVGACWDQIIKRLPGMQEWPDVAWQVLCDLMESGCLLVSPKNMAAMDFVYLGDSIEDLLARYCWKDKKVDNNSSSHRVLPLLKVIVEKQHDFFAAMGVTFPTWDGRPLTVKNLVHCLGQYSNYLQIQSDLKNELSEGGKQHRVLVSRSYMDVSKTCRFCDIQTDDGLFCDACLCFYCQNCESENVQAAPEHWICNPCHEMDQLQFVE